LTTKWLDTAWGEAYRVIGLAFLMDMARFWSWFDWHAIDGVVDGLARSVRALGGTVRHLQSGQIQNSLYASFLLATVVLVTFILYHLL
jgi:multicomponent Na+:H+ antiporter subunit D